MFDTPTNSSFSAATRRTNIAELDHEHFDLIVLGAGITGAGIARDAAMRGIRTALIDKSDYGSGTSGKSSRLVHGGLRYLETGEIKLVFEASRERRILLRIAPHLVRPRSFLFPLHRGGRIPKWKMAAGLWLYDLLSLFRNVRRHQMLSKHRLLQCEPMLKEQDLVGGARYWDAQCDDARLTLANVRSAHRHGACVANYVAVEGFDRADGRIQGAVARDAVTDRTFTIKGRVVVNATGPWSDGITGANPPNLRPTKGSHIAVQRSKVGNNEALLVTSPLDGRVMFIIPWGNLTYVGTTDTDEPPDPDWPYASVDDVTYLLRSINSVFPNARLTPDDVVATWAGYRPLLKPRDPCDPSSASREHRLLENEEGLISIVGGKLTTYRSMAAEAVDRVAQRLEHLDGRTVSRSAPTATESLPGGETGELDVVEKELLHDGIGPAASRHLVRTFGTEAASILHLVQADRSLGESLIQGHPAIRAEI
ncbi:MAG: glycerol-3-phosphate dehydrogenase/oxidase, partial [Gemmatimonadales bacterium]